MRGAPLALTFLASLVAWSSSSLHRWDLEGTTICARLVSEEFYTMSITICGAFCMHRSCTSFTYQVGACVLFNSGQAVSSPIMKYRFMTTPINVAAMKPTTATTRYAGEIKERGNDCNTTTTYHSNGASYPWYNVDLGLVYPISKIRMRPSHFSSLHHWRFQSIDVKAGDVPAVSGDASAYALLGHFVGPFDNKTCCIDFDFDPPVTARYVHIQRTANTGDDFIIITELEVYA